MSKNEDDIVLRVLDEKIAEIKATFAIQLAQLEEGKRGYLASKSPVSNKPVAQYTPELERSLFPPVIPESGETTVKQRFKDAIMKTGDDFTSEEIFTAVNNDGGRIVEKKTCTSTFARLKNKAYAKLAQRRGGVQLYQKIPRRIVEV